MASAEEVDWRIGLSLLERHRYVLEGQYKSDVTFVIVEGHRKVGVTAHKFPLICGSAVFEEMFGTRPLSDNQPIVLTDDDSSAFKEMLRFLYCEEATICLDNVMSLLHISKKYKVSQLIDKCVEFLQSEITVKNVCNILEGSVRYDELGLIQKCLTFVERHSTDVLASTKFSILSNKSLILILESNKLTVHNEVEVYEACLRWADAKCLAEGRDNSDTNRRAVLGSALYKIRFPAMLFNQFGSIASRTKLLTDSEKADVYSHISVHGDGSSSCDCKLLFDKCGRRYSVLVSRYSHRIPGNNYRPSGPDAIDFKCNLDCELIGCGLYGTISPSTYNIGIKVLDSNGHIVSSFTVSMEADGRSTPQKIGFQIPVGIKADTVYSFVIGVTGIVSFSGQLGTLSVRQGNFCVEFSDSKYSSSGHTLIQHGQIPELLFRLSP